MVQQSGFGIVEALVGLALSMIVLGVCYTIMLSNRTQKPVDQNVSSLETLLLYNAVEVNGLSYNDPSLVPNTCILRKYDSNNNFVNQTSFGTASTNCGQPMPPLNQSYVYWMIQAVPPGTLTFTPSNFLKLPVYSPPVLQVTIGVLGYPSGPNGTIFQKQVVIDKGSL